MGIRAFTYACIIGFCLFLLGFVTKGSFANQSCHSPCTVHFPVGTEEDDFAIDYTHRQLRVWINRNH